MTYYRICYDKSCFSLLDFCLLGLRPASCIACFLHSIFFFSVIARQFNVAVLFNCFCRSNLVAFGFEIAASRSFFALLAMTPFILYINFIACRLLCFMIYCHDILYPRLLDYCLLGKYAQPTFFISLNCHLLLLFIFSFSYRWEKKRLEINLL